MSDSCQLCDVPDLLSCGVQFNIKSKSSDSNAKCCHNVSVLYFVISSSFLNFMFDGGETLRHCCLVYFLLVNIGEIISVVHASAYNFSFSKYYTYLTCPNMLKVLNFKAKTFTVSKGNTDKFSQKGKEE